MMHKASGQVPKGISIRSGFSAARENINFRFLSGARIAETHIYKPGSYPFDLIAPVLVVWKPTVSARDDASLCIPTDSVSSINSSEFGTDCKKSAPEDSPRTAWIRVHPAAFDDVYLALQAAASTTLYERRIARGNAYPKEEVELADLRGELNVFEIMGPKASQVIKGALHPVKDDEREDFKKVMCKLTHA